MNDWIIDDTRPPNTDFVLVYNAENKETWPAFWSEERGVWLQDDGPSIPEHYVDAWIPFPAPPKELT